ncbi:MAG: cell division protein ZapA [Thiotrichales bacterium]|nr:cell division protein ZapA [Thiotrichales bacterium]
MTNQNAVTIQILDKEYMVSCPDEERDELIESARYLDERMRKTRDAGKVLGTERMAVMTALNIVHELLRSRRSHSESEQGLSSSIDTLTSKVEAALSRSTADV